MKEQIRRPLATGPTLTVLASRPTFRGAEILVQANRSASVIVDSFIGSRRFYLSGGDRIRVKVKGGTWPKGYEMTLRELVYSAKDWSKIPWRYC